MTYSGSLAQSGRGTSLAIGSTPTPIGELSDFPLTRGKWGTADVTNFESGSDSEFIATIRKPGTLTLKGNRVSSDAGQVLVEAAYQDGVLQPFVATLPKTAAQTTIGDKYTFNALVLDYSFTITVEKQIEFSIELQISGAVTLTVGS